MAYSKSDMERGSYHGDSFGAEPPLAPAATVPFATQHLGPLEVAPEDRGSCRLCEAHASPSNPATELIAPCGCAGESRWVHKACLDKWRATSSRPTAFTNCTECGVRYHMTIRGS